jgi:hypothetical protein
MAIPFYFSGLCFLQKLARFHECFHNWLLWNWAVIIDFCTFGLLPNSLNHLWSNRHRFKCLMYIDLFSLDLSAASFLFVHRIWTNFIDLSRKHEHEHVCTCCARRDGRRRGHDRWGGAHCIMFLESLTLQQIIWKKIGSLYNVFLVIQRDVARRVVGTPIFYRYLSVAWVRERTKTHHSSSV